MNLCQALRMSCFITAKTSDTSQLRQAVSKYQTPAQASSSSKNAGPALRAYRLLTQSVISRSDLQCFSHEDGCVAAGNEVREQPVLTVTDIRLSSKRSSRPPVWTGSSFRACIIRFKRPEIIQNSHDIRSLESLSGEVRHGLRVRCRICSIHVP